MPVSMKRLWISRSRHGVRLSRYSEPPSRKTRRGIVTSCQSIPSSFSHSAKVIETSAIPSAGRESVPEKMTSVISPPRSALADCSPSTQMMASSTLDLPHPLGPTTQVTPRWKLRTVLGAKDLKPMISSDWRYMRGCSVGIERRQLHGGSARSKVQYDVVTQISAHHREWSYSQFARRSPERERRLPR